MVNGIFLCFQQYPLRVMGKVTNILNRKLIGYSNRYCIRVIAEQVKDFPIDFSTVINFLGIFPNDLYIAKRNSDFQKDVFVCCTGIHEFGIFWDDSLWSNDSAVAVLWKSIFCQ